ncbi:LysE family translocator [Nostocoides vanveenii]|uniref:LysE family translocator n=1 Tax=Nostocoides vanveenii TaxID=330835 RepID=A0ABN2K2A3_9MICO
MPDPSRWLAFLVASIVLAAIPGPSLLFVIGRAISAGRREALLSVLGNATGILTQILLIAAGLGPVVASSATAYAVVKAVGALYLVYLGISTIRHRDAASRALREMDTRPQRHAAHALRDGFLVGATNPKTIVFFVALLPQFVTTGHGPVWMQLVILGLTFFAVAVASDSIVAVLAGRARDWLANSPGRLARMNAAGGVMMILLACALALTGRPAPAPTS